MTHRSSLVRSIPFWTLVGGAAVSAVAGVLVLVDRLDGMTRTLLDGTATGVDVYVGQTWALFGAILTGAGLVGLALALSIAALSGRLSHTPRAAVGADAADGLFATDPTAPAATEQADEFGYAEDLGYEENEHAVQDGAGSERADTEPEPVR